MISLEFIGTIEDTAKVVKDENGAPTAFTFIVDVTSYGKDKEGKTKARTKRIFCKRKGACAAITRFVGGQNIYVQGSLDVKGKDFYCEVWRFELV